MAINLDEPVSREDFERSLTALGAALEDFRVHSKYCTQFYPDAARRVYPGFSYRVSEDGMRYSSVVTFPGEPDLAESDGWLTEADLTPGGWRKLTERKREEEQAGGMRRAQVLREVRGRVLYCTDATRFAYPISIEQANQFLRTADLPEYTGEAREGNPYTLVISMNLPVRHPGTRTEATNALQGSLREFVESLNPEVVNVADFVATSSAVRTRRAPEGRVPASDTVPLL